MSQPAAEKSSPTVAAPDLPVVEPGPAPDARRSIALLETILEALSDGVLALDLRGRILYWSPSCVRLTGCESAQAIGRPAERVMGEIAARLKELSRGGVTGFLTVAGIQVPVEVEVIPVDGPGGVRIGKVCALRDLRATLEEKAIHERTRALARLGESVAWAVHQIRNPLGATAGFADLLARDLHGAPTEPLLEKIREGFREIDRRISDILCYARPRPLQIVPVDLARLLKQVRADVAARFPRGPRIICERPADGTVGADPVQLRQALENLVVNAAEAAGVAGRVRILLQEGRDSDGNAAARVLVRNSGSELSTEALGSVFEPFASTKARGTGLGLPLAKRIVEAHGGLIEVVSAGGWTTFVITLPRQQVLSRGREAAVAAAG